jgi:hypothetical protein
MSIPKMDEEAGTKRRRTKPADARLREAISRAIAKSKTHGRPAIAQAVGRDVGFKVTARMLNDFSSAAKKPARFPAVLVRAFCKVTGQDELERMVISPRLRRLLRIAEAELRASVALKELEGLRQRELKQAGKKARR